MALHPNPRLALSSASEPRIGRLSLHLLQAAVYAALAQELDLRWRGYAVALVLAALVQIVGALAVWKRWQRIQGGSALVSLLPIAYLYEEVITQALYMNQAFGPQTAEVALNTLAIPALLLPWLVAFPLSQLPRLRQAAVLLLLLLPALRAAGGPLGQGDPDMASRVAQAAIKGEKVPANTLLSVLEQGEILQTRRAGAEGLGGPQPAGNYLVDVPVGEVPEGLIRPGADAPFSQKAVSPVAYARAIKRKEVLPKVSVPGVERSYRYRSVIVSENTTQVLTDAWAAQPDPQPSAAALDAAIRAGAEHLVGNMQEDGRFTYIVKGPSGEAGRGYNYPRHAGTCWFLARAAAALQEPRFADAADRALRHLEQQSQYTSDGRAYILDPDRSDGKAWAGTTALAVLALSLRNNQPELLEAWTRQLAASVDDIGKVRGDMTIKTGIFPEQPANPYGQGQVVLALAAAERAGQTVGSEALSRAIRYLEHDYAGSAHPLVVADEHWMCLTAVALQAQRQSAAGDGVCAAYVAKERFDTPVPGAALQPSAGPAGGLAEAVVAHAWQAGGEWTARSIRYAWLFLRSQYVAGDAPLLGQPQRLLGGFRDAPGALDVQIDAVQHIGGALLGIEALISGRLRPGSMP